MFTPAPDAILIEDLEFQFRGTHFAGQVDQQGKIKKFFNAKIPNTLKVIKKDGSVNQLAFETRTEMAIYLQSIGWPIKIRAQKEELRAAMMNSGVNGFEQALAFFRDNGVLDDEHIDFHMEVRLVYDDPNPKYPAPVVQFADPVTMQFYPVDELAVAKLDNASITKFDALIYPKYWSNDMSKRSGYTARLGEARVWLASSPFTSMYPGYTYRNLEEKDISDLIQEDPEEQ